MCREDPQTWPCWGCGDRAVTGACGQRALGTGDKLPESGRGWVGARSAQRVYMACGKGLGGGPPGQTGEVQKTAHSSVTQIPGSVFIWATQGVSQPPGRTWADVASRLWAALLCVVHSLFTISVDPKPHVRGWVPVCGNFVGPAPSASQTPT